MRNTIKALLCLAATCAILVPAVSNAQGRGYEYKFNGFPIQSDSELVPGPNGCDSEYVNKRTGEPFCAGKGRLSPRASFNTMIFNYCPIRKYKESSCVGGFVAVGEKCPQRPNLCQYYRIVQERNQMGGYEVAVNDIDRRGWREIWIVKSTDPYWGLFSRCHSSQFVKDRRGAC